MKQPLIFLLSMLLAGAVAAQAPARVRGTITALDGNVVSVKSREGRDLKADGRLVATRVQVTKDGVRPPQ
jgi:formylmethanofuran:tetrahydromethanopterin formyltransferase